MNDVGISNTVGDGLGDELEFKSKCDEMRGASSGEIRNETLAKRQCLKPIGSECGRT